MHALLFVFIFFCCSIMRGERKRKGDAEATLEKQNHNRPQAKYLRRSTAGRLIVQVKQLGVLSNIQLSFRKRQWNFLYPSFKVLQYTLFCIYTLRNYSLPCIQRYWYGRLVIEKSDLVSTKNQVGYFLLHALRNQRHHSTVHYNGPLTTVDKRRYVILEI